MSIAFVASHLNVRSSSQSADGSRQDTQGGEAAASFGRVLSDATAAPAPAARTDSAPPARSARRPADVVGKSRPEPQESEPSEANPDTEPSVPAMSVIDEPEEPATSAETVDTNAVGQESEREEAPLTPELSTVVAVMVPPQPVRAQPESDDMETAAAPRPAGVATAQPDSAKQPVKLADDASECSERNLAAEPGSGAGIEIDSQDIAPHDAFADGLEHALKKLEPQPDAGQSAVASSPSGATTVAMAAAGQGATIPPHVAAQPNEARPAAPPEQQFAQANQGSIINGIRTQLLPGGGTMQIRLSPPELGAMQVRVEMRGDTLAATFQTSNEQAAQLLTHSLGQLKQALEQQGVSVGRLQVVSSPRNDGARTGQESDQSAAQWQGYQQQQDDQRREVLRQLWNRAAYGRDPIDLFA